MLRNQAHARWEPFDVEEIAGRSMGIVGYGEIGKACAARAAALGMRVRALRRKPAGDDPLVERWHSPAELPEMLAASDYVVVAAPLTPETRGMIGAAAIDAMKSSAVIVNVGRGPVIDEGALVSALSARKIRGAALDVFETEPLPPAHPFWSLDNVLLSPHCADHVEGWLESSVRFFVQNFERFSKGEPLLNLVDKKAGY
jgi:phosphoglycerate dehydrogenase-like enzyme